MSQNWMRHFELQLVDENGQGIELSDFKVTFTIDWFNISSASRVGTFKIYNLSADTDLAFATSITSQTLAAGYTTEDMFRLLMKDFEAKGATVGRTPVFPPTVFPRGRALFGMTRHLMDNVAAQCGATWQFVDGQLNMLPEGEYMHDAIVLNSATGLIGMPQQTIGNGVNVRALINPNIRVNGLIQLDQASVFRTALSNNDIAMAGGQITDQNTDGNITLSGTTAQPASIATDGVYVVKGIMYTGDTRGQAWYMDMMCEARGAADLNSKSYFDKTSG
ncbi:hypothetical protein GTM03_003796 [Salmonella enterica]|nr:hypothetical protein [Salmonella enterica]